MKVGVGILVALTVFAVAAGVSVRSMRTAPANRFVYQPNRAERRPTAAPCADDIVGASGAEKLRREDGGGDLAGANNPSAQPSPAGLARAACAGAPLIYCTGGATPIANQRGVAVGCQRRFR